MSRVDGEVAPRFERVRDAFAANFEHNGEVGAACSVYHRGEKVVDLWGGVADQESGRRGSGCARCSRRRRRTPHGQPSRGGPRVAEGVKAPLYVLAAGLAAICLAPAPVAQAADGQTARPLSAFFGLDNALPFGANRLCLGASGKDGMPVVLSHTVDAETLAPEDFRVVTQSGAERTPMCVTLRPATDAGERRTVLLIGEFGDAADDPPARVRVVEDLFSDGAMGGRVNFRGTQTPVTPLDAGPSLVLAEVVAEHGRATEDRGSACPDSVQQVVRATWAGGVRRPDGDDAGDAVRALYRVTVERADGSRDEIVPTALADLGDRDNNHLLCLDTSDPALSVSFPAGHLVDPNQDLNPDTRVAVDGSLATRHVAHQ